MSASEYDWGSPHGSWGSDDFKEPDRLSAVTTTGSINHSDQPNNLRDGVVQQSNAFFTECRERRDNTSYLEHIIRAGITVTSFAGSVAFFFGAKQLVINLLGNSPLVKAFATAVGIDSLALSSMPLAGMGVATVQDMQPSSEEEKAFLEPSPKSTCEYGIRVILGCASAAPIAGMTYLVFMNANGVVLWGGTIAAFIALAFGTIPSVLGMKCSTPNELKVGDGEGLSAAQLSVLRSIENVMAARIEANKGKLPWLSRENLPQDSIALLEYLLTDPAPSYSGWLKFCIAAGTTASFWGMFGYAGGTGLLVKLIFNRLSHIPQLILTNVTTGCFILAFGNLMRLSCKGGFSDLYRAIAAAVGSKEGFIEFIQKEILSMRFFPKATIVIGIALGILGAGTGGTNFRACYEMTLAVLNSLTDGYWEKYVPAAVTYIIQWVTAVCGAINSSFFNARGSMIAILNIFLLQYGHHFFHDEDLKEILKFVNGSQLYLRKFNEECPLGKRMLLLAHCKEEVIDSVLAEATKDNRDEEAPSITLRNWPQVVDAIKVQRGVRLSDSRYAFSNKPGEVSGETRPLLPTVEEIENSASCGSKMCLVM